MFRLWLYKNNIQQISLFLKSHNKTSFYNSHKIANFKFNEGLS